MALVGPYGPVPAKDVLQTYTGKLLRPLDPWPGDFDIRDIAWALAMQCRYNGHTKMFYSVATHCLLVASFCPTALQLEGLLHDASEAYLCDLPSPLKQAMPEYRKHEEALEACIATQFHLVYPMHPKVKWADDYVFQLECDLVMGGPMAAKFALPGAPGERAAVEVFIKAHAALPPAAVAEEYLDAYKHIVDRRGREIEAAKAEELR